MASARAIKLIEPNSISNIPYTQRNVQFSIDVPQRLLELIAFSFFFISFHFHHRREQKPPKMLVERQYVSSSRQRFQWLMSCCCCCCCCSLPYYSLSDCMSRTTHWPFNVLCESSTQIKKDEAKIPRWWEVCSPFNCRIPHHDDWSPSFFLFSKTIRWTATNNNSSSRRRRRRKRLFARISEQKCAQSKSQPRGSISLSLSLFINEWLNWAAVETNYRFLPTVAVFTYGLLAYLMVAIIHILPLKKIDFKPGLSAKQGKQNANLFLFPFHI